MWNKQWAAQTVEKFISKVLTKLAEKFRTADWESGEKSQTGTSQQNELNRPQVDSWVP